MALEYVMNPRLSERPAPPHRCVLITANVSSLHTGLCYVAPSLERLYNCMYEPPDGLPQHNCKYEAHTVRITDARGLSAAPAIHREGFELWNAPSEVVDFRDDEEVRDRKSVV